MQERGMITNMDLKVYLGELKNNPKFTDEMLQLVEEDLRFGLTPKETEKYTGKKLDLLQMKAYSRCLRGGYDKDVIAVIAKEGLTGEQMMVALEFYEKGVPLDAVKEITENSSQTAFTMKKLFQNVMARLAKTDQKPETEEKYAEELLKQVRAVVEKIEFQEKRYDMLNDKLQELQTAGQDMKIQSNLLEQLSDKDRLLEQQQNELNEARITIVKLKNEIDGLGKEKKDMEKVIEEMKQAKDTPGGQATAAENRDLQVQSAGGQNLTEQAKVPFYPSTYQAALLDADGRVVQMVPVERTEPRKNTGMLTALFSRVCYKKKIDIVKLVAERDLLPEQLVQVRSAIEKGLNEDQLMVLINNNLPADQMAEIINIAEYENKQKGEA